MAVVTTYVCDVTGVSGTDFTDFTTVNIASVTEQKVAPNGYQPPSSRVTVSKLVHKDVAEKLNLLEKPKGDGLLPEATFESKLKTLLTTYIDDIVYESVDSAVQNMRGH